MLHCATLGIYIILSVIIQSFNCISSVKMTVTVNSDSMTLSCLVTERDSRKNIYLFCPLVSGQHNCRENCNKQCFNENCLADSLIDCHDQGFNADSGVYRIDYVIDGSRSDNHGKWYCQYGGTSSSVVYVNASTSPKSIVSQEIVTTTKYSQEIINKPLNENNKSNRDPSRRSHSQKKSLSTDNNESGFPYDKLMSRNEFIIAVIGLLAISLICNVFFCSRMIIVHCRSKKKTSNNSQYFSMDNHHPPYNHSNSQVSDPDRIYEDTSINHRQLSFLTQIKNGNGNYLATNTLTPGSGISTMLPQLSFNQTIPLQNSPSDSGSTQMHHPFLVDPALANYASVNFPVENSYTNFVPMQSTEMMYRRDCGNSTASQPVYLAFQSQVPATINQLMTAGNRYVQYSSQPLQTMAVMPSENRLAGTQPRLDTAPATATSLIIQPSPQRSPSTPEESKSNYQLSREMMEEADTLLRTADTLLKSTEHEMKYYPQC